MAEVILTNMGDFTAEYDGEIITFSSTEVKTTIVHGITAVKSADKSIWVNGPLLYTVVLTNDSGMPLTDGTFTDQLDIALITLDEAHGIYINGVKTAHTFDAGGVLLVEHLPTIAPGESITITFQVLQK